MRKKKPKKKLEFKDDDFIEAKELIRLYAQLRKQGKLKEAKVKS